MAWPKKTQPTNFNCFENHIFDFSFFRLLRWSTDQSTPRAHCLPLHLPSRKVKSDGWWAMGDDWWVMGLFLCELILEIKGGQF